MKISEDRCLPMEYSQAGNNNIDQESAGFKPSRPDTAVQVISAGKSGFDLPAWRKWVILAVVSWNTLLVSYSATALLVATPEISSDLHTTSETIDALNAAVLVINGCSPLLWNPFSDVFGRRVIYNISIMFILLPSIGLALAPNFATFVAMRLISALMGTYMMVAGQTFISDIFEPVSLSTCLYGLGE